MTPNDMDRLRAQTSEGEKSGFRGRNTTYPYPHETIHRLQTLGEPSDLESILNNIELTMSHIIRDIMMVITITPPEQASLAVRDYHALMSGMAVYPASEERIYRLAARLPRIILNYFLHEATYYSRVKIDNIELIIEREPQIDEAGNPYVEVMLSDHSRLKLPVIHSVMVRGIGSDALRQELFALFRLRQQLFRGISNVAKNNHKVVVTVAGLTAMMAEASKDGKVLEAIKHELNQQILSIFDTHSEIALVDKNTEIGSFKMEVAQIGDQMNFIYTELARILQIPKTKLLGDSPSGLDATGEYDYKNYQDMLEGVRANVVYPFLRAMDIHYTVSLLRDMATVNQAVATVVLAEQQLSNLRTDGLREIYQNILGSDGLKIISDRNINVVATATVRDDAFLYEDEAKND